MLKASFWPTHGCSAAGHCCCLQNVRHCSRGRAKYAALFKQSCGLLLPRSRSMIALPESGGISRFLESLMCLRAPLRAQGFWPTHECRAAGWALRHLLTYCVTLQQGPCGICSIVRTDFRAPAATPPQQEPSGIGSMIALPDGGGISRFLEFLMMCLRAPLRAQGLWPTHECSAAGH